MKKKEKNDEKKVEELGYQYKEMVQWRNRKITVTRSR